MVNVDYVLDAIGGRGRYQFLQYFCMIIATSSAAFQLLNIVFVGRDVPHVCKRPANLSDVYSASNQDGLDDNNTRVFFEKCKIIVEANISDQAFTRDLICLYGYEYEDKKETSLMSDMDVVCDEAPLQSLGQTLLVLGQAIGALVLTGLSDRYGRRTVLLISHTCLIAIGLGIAFVPTYPAFLVLRVFLGFFQQGIVLAFHTYNIEIFATRYRKDAGIMTSLIWSSSTALIPLIAFLMRSYSWRYTQLAYCSVSLSVIIQFIFLDESLAWLITNRKTKQVEKNLKKAAHISGKDINAVLQAYKDHQNSEPEPNGDVKTAKKEELQKDATKPSFLDLMKRKRLSLTVFVLWFTWMTDSLTYFGLYMTSHALAGSRYINVLLFAIVETPSILLFYLIVDRVGRKKTSMTLHGTAGIALMMATILKSVGKDSEWSGTAVTVFTCIGMFGASGAWGVSFFMTTEIFPTNLRNFGLGTASAFSRLGGMIAPFSNQLAEYVPWAPGAIFGGCCLVVTILVNFLPETMGRDLPQTLDDMEACYKKSPTTMFRYEKDIKMKEVKY